MKAAVGTILLLVFCGTQSLAAEKKSIAYLGIACPEDLAVSLHHRTVIELNIRKEMELPRFEYIEISPQKHLTIDEFLEAYRTLVHRSAVEAAGKERPVWADSAERIVNSAFFYQITLTDYRVEIIESLSATDARVYLNARVDFFRLNLSDPQKPAYVREASLLPEDPAVLHQRLAVVAEGHSQIDEMVARYAHTLGRNLSLEMHRLPAFRLRAGIEKVESDGVRMGLGLDMGVYTDMGFEVVHPGVEGHPLRPCHG